LVVLVVFILFFSILGYILFHNDSAYKDPYGYYSTMQLSILNTIFLFTGTNYPDILIPFYKVKNANSLYFIFFIVIGN
jgi:two pore calcium channel protein